MPPQTSGRSTLVAPEMTRLTSPPPEKRPADTDPDPAVKTGQPPADGGLRAWLVVLVSFLCNGVIFGIINCYGVLYVAFLEQMETAGVANAAFKCCEYTAGGVNNAVVCRLALWCMQCVWDRPIEWVSVVSTRTLVACQAISFRCSSKYELLSYKVFKNDYFLFAAP